MEQENGDVIIYKRTDNPNTTVSGWEYRGTVRGPDNDTPKEFKDVETKPTELKNPGMESWVPDRLPTGRGIGQAVGKAGKEATKKAEKKADGFIKAIKKTLGI
jgi:hypothetical protein